MLRQYRHLLIIAVTLTAAAIMHDYKYDPPAQPYTVWQYILEIIIMGPLMTAVFFAVLLGIYSIYRATKKLIARLRGQA